MRPRVRTPAVGDDPDLSAGDRAGRSAGVAHARAAWASWRHRRRRSCVTMPKRGGVSSSCCATSRWRNPSRLERMQDLGLLAAMMPEWEPCTARVQHDLYHVYTVDQHQLYALAMHEALARGELTRATFPEPSETRGDQAAGRAGARHAAARRRQAVRQPAQRDGRGPRGDHRRRLGIDEQEIKLTDFLVRQHLTMAQLSQRRDLDDLG